MKKFIAATGVLLSAALVTPAFAQNDKNVDVSVTGGTATSADLACMSAAVNARETATVNASAALSVSVSAALTARQSALASAFTIADNNARSTAIMAAWDAYFTATAKAFAKYKTDVKTSNDTFATASANCHIDTDHKVIKKKYKGNRGWHHGWYKNNMKDRR
jgi:hypothetical protein